MTRSGAVVAFLVALAAAVFLSGTAHAVNDSVDPRGGITSVDHPGVATSQGGFTSTTTKDLARADTINRRLGVAAEQGPPQWLLDRCLEHPDAGEAGGHVMFRQFWCQRNIVYGQFIYPPTGEREGWFVIPYRAAAIGNPYTRQMHYFFHGDDYFTDGSFSGDSSLSLRAHCIELTAGCSVDREDVTMDIGDWDDGQWLRWNFRSDENVATQQPEKVLRNKFTLSGEAVDDFGRRVELDSVTRPNIRCDSATYFPGQPRSCVFTDVLSRLPYVFGAGYDEVVTHIKGAYERPDLTHPFKLGKSIPGRWGDPPDPRALHRITPGSKAHLDNRAAKDSACETLPPHQPDQECDEFPFASTLEGAGFGDGNFSVKYVNNRQNERAGGILSAYYAWDRVLRDDNLADGTLDEFWVNVP
jgi:Deoxyribonuclease NucA/NucB